MLEVKQSDVEVTRQHAVARWR